jgi:hypothetical protein
LALQLTSGEEKRALFRSAHGTAGRIDKGDPLQVLSLAGIVKLRKNRQAAQV